MILNNIKSYLKIFLTLTLISLLPAFVTAQEILMTIGDKEITLEEFERIYNKNNSNVAETQQTPEEYLDLFINFKLKVLEAENLGMDTTEKFLNEFNNYKEQLAKPYLTDDETKERLMKEAYERMKYDVHVSHILLNMGNSISPEDTLLRYNRALEIRQRILDGEDFATVAKATSDDPSARMNGGDLGYFTVFTMVYPFETAAYNLEDGEISMPVRTRHGYHILKKHATRPAIGKIKVAHIYKAVPPNTPPEEQKKLESRVMAVYDSIKQGVSFGELAARHSDDRNSASRGGELPWFGTGRMIPEFEKQAFSLQKSGDVSEPFRTSYGWHIAKLIDKKGIGTYEEMRSELQSKSLRGDREKVKRKLQLDKLKEKYDFKLNRDIYNRLYDLVDSSIFKSQWYPYSNTDGFTEPLFYLGQEKGKTLGQFVRHLEISQRERELTPNENFIGNMFNEYLVDYLVKLEKESLPERYPEYNYILQEYHDGILLFDLMSEKVWNQAVNDTTGLYSFFVNNRDQYMWGERIKIIEVTADTLTDMSKVKRKYKRVLKGRWGEKKLNRRYCDNDTLQCININTLLVEDIHDVQKSEQLSADGSVTEIFRHNDKNKILIRCCTVPPMEKELDEVRGQVTSDYQDYLEKHWIEDLRNKYEVNVNEAVLSKVKQAN